MAEYWTFLKHSYRNLGWRNIPFIPFYILAELFTLFLILFCEDSEGGYSGGNG